MGSVGSWISTLGPMVLFWANFVMSPKWWSSIQRFSQIWLQAKYENKIIKHPSIFLANILGPCIKNENFFLKISQILAIERKTLKELDF